MMEKRRPVTQGYSTETILFVLKMREMDPASDISGNPSDTSKRY